VASSSAPAIGNDLANIDTFVLLLARGWRQCPSIRPAASGMVMPKSNESEQFSRLREVFVCIGGSDVSAPFLPSPCWRGRNISWRIGRLAGAAEYGRQASRPAFHPHHPKPAEPVPTAGVGFRGEIVIGRGGGMTETLATPTT
jgi:hypothetical protein